MAVTAEFVPDQAKTEAVEAHVIWMTTGLACDGDSVAMTSAINPSLEDIITQAIPGMPKVIVHNPVLAYENGEEFMQAWWDAERASSTLRADASRARSRTSGLAARATGRRWASTPRPGSRSRPANGSTALRRRRRRSSRSAPAPPTAGSRR